MRDSRAAQLSAQLSLFAAVRRTQHHTLQQMQHRYLNESRLSLCSEIGLELGKRVGMYHAHVTRHFCIFTPWGTVSAVLLSSAPRSRFKKLCTRLISSRLGERSCPSSLRLRFWTRGLGRLLRQVRSFDNGQRQPCGIWLWHATSTFFSRPGRLPAATSSGRILAVRLPKNSFSQSCQLGYGQRCQVDRSSAVSVASVSPGVDHHGPMPSVHKNRTPRQGQRATVNWGQTIKTF